MTIHPYEIERVREDAKNPGSIASRAIVDAYDRTHPRPRRITITARTSEGSGNCVTLSVDRVKQFVEILAEHAQITEILVGNTHVLNRKPQIDYNEIDRACQYASR